MYKRQALCRAKADWLIGINATRLFSCLYGKTLNVGRVQTPTLKMLTDRDDEGEDTVHFLNQVDEADLMALMEDGSKMCIRDRSIFSAH